MSPHIDAPLYLDMHGMMKKNQHIIIKLIRFQWDVFTVEGEGNSFELVNCKLKNKPHTQSSWSFLQTSVVCNKYKASWCYSAFPVLKLPSY